MMKDLVMLIEALEANIPKHGALNPAVSATTAGWHIEHSLLTINQVIDQLKNSDPKDYVWSFNIPRFVVLTFKKIPKGKAKAPASVQPKIEVTEEGLKNHIVATKQRLGDLEGLTKYNYFNHPFFGKITNKLTQSFLVIHTSHHLDIINEIIKTV